MKKIKNTNISKTIKEPMTLRTKALWIGTAGLVVLIAIVLMIVESMRGSIRVYNATDDLKLEYVKAYFIDAEGPIEEQTFQFDNIESNQKEKQTLEEINLLGLEANLEIRFKFENYDELFVDAGYFNDNFKGDIKIGFEQVEDGLVRLKVKANNGFLPSTLIDCNEIHEVYYKDGFIAE